jgi:putative flippase GtrA
MALLQKAAVELGRIVRFGMTGTVAALAYTLVAFAIVEARIAGPMVAAVVGYAAAMTISYLGHLYFSFRVEPDHRVFFPRFAFTVAVTFTLTMASTWLITKVWLYPFGVAIVAVTVLMPAISYGCSRFWVFLPGLRATAPAVD